MGNCCTTNPGKEAVENANLPTNCKQNRTPPPSHPLLEEELVKEVLSEIPTWPRRPAVFRNRQENDEPRKFTHSLTNFPSIPDGKLRKDTGLKKPTTSFNPDELSEDASEICSTQSETVSTATYFTEKNDEDVAEIRQRSPAKLRNRSHSGDARREWSAGRSPAKKCDSSPNRLRSSSGRDTRGLGPNLQKRDLGESSGRRSRSPATRTDGGVAKVSLNRTSSARRTGKCPGRIRSEVGVRIGKLDEAKSISSSTCNRESRDNKWPPTSNESLENPLVSLECFIFL